MFNYKRVAELEKRIREIEDVIDKYMNAAGLKRVWYPYVSPSSYLECETKRVKELNAEIERTREIRECFDKWLAEDKKSPNFKTGFIDGCRYHTSEETINA
jgi:hypothetical protein